MGWGEWSFLTKRRNSNIILGSAGGVPEWLKGADCKSVGLAPTLVRIQPPPPRSPQSGALARDVAVVSAIVCLYVYADEGVEQQAKRWVGTHAGGCSSMVEQKPSKLTTRVRFPSPAPNIVLVGLDCGASGTK